MNEENFKMGNIATSECFDKYTKNPSDYYDRMGEEKNILGCEMECFALFKTAEFLGKKAACLLTVVDANYTKRALTSEEREKDLGDMIEIALESVVSIEERIEKLEEIEKIEKDMISENEEDEEEMDSLDTLENTYEEVDENTGIMFD